MRGRCRNIPSPTLPLAAWKSISEHFPPVPLRDPRSKTFGIGNRITGQPRMASPTMESRTLSLIVVSALLGFLATVATVLRFYARSLSRMGYGLDDYLTIAGLVGVKTEVLSITTYIP